MNQPFDASARDGDDLAVSTVVFEGYIGEMNDEKVVIFPRLDRRYSIEIRRQDVLDFEAGRSSGACRFIVPASAPVQERITLMTTAHRARAASDISLREALAASERDHEELADWVRDPDWTQPD